MNFAVRIMIVFALMLLLEFYFIKKTGKTIAAVFPVLKRKGLRVIIKVVLVYLNLYPLFLLFYYIKGSVLPDNRLVDYNLVFPFWTYIFIVIQSVLFFFIVLIIKGLLYPYYKKHKEGYTRNENKIILAIVVFSVLYVPSRIIFDYYTINVRHVVFTKKNLNPALNNFRLVFISDIHADRHTDEKRLDKYIYRVNRLKPDLVLIGGDMISASPDYIETAAEYMGKIKAKYGVYSCRGDHDHWAYRNDLRKSISEVTGELAKYNVPMLHNENLTLNVDSAKILISFITYTYAERIKPEVLTNLLSDKKEDLNVVLAHQPEGGIPEEAAENNYDLVLSGHTHGGQITFLFPFFNLSPTLIETRYVRGDFKIGNLLLVVTRGLGMSLIPMRLNSTPEITFITIKGN
jgi:hypothetical protein